MNERLIDVYSVSHNVIAPQVEDVQREIVRRLPTKEIRPSTIKPFKPVNPQEVRDKIRRGEIKIYKKRVDIPKDERWNRKLVQSQIIQGMEAGESIPKIAKRLQAVTNMNEKAAIRNARTMVTCAESVGRQASYDELERAGFVLIKEWIATHDSRVREWHLELDGQTRKTGETFENSVGKIRYPADPQAKGANIYNCRCRMRGRIFGFRRSDGTIEKV